MARASSRSKKIRHRHSQQRPRAPSVLSKEWFNADEDELDVGAPLANERFNVAFALSPTNPVAIARQVFANCDNVSPAFILHMCEKYEKSGNLKAESEGELTNLVLSWNEYDVQQWPTWEEFETDLSEDRLYGDDKIMAVKLLANEFLDIPIEYITSTLDFQHTMKKTYQRLWEELRMRRHYYRENARPFVAIPLNPNVDNNMMRARLLMRELRPQRSINREIERTEREIANELEAQRSGNIHECPICCSDKPDNRFASCNGPEPHQVCYTCVSQSLDVEVGYGKCRLNCIGSTDCKIEYKIDQLRKFAQQKTMKVFLQLQQQHEVRSANLPDLERCPFCPFALSCDVPEGFLEFRCHDPRCGKISCLACKAEFHDGKSCAEAAADLRHNNIRQTIDEAMSQAMIRKCNACDMTFVKEDGCNKMTCSVCLNKQCYVCGQNVESYEHFHRPEAGCPLYDVDLSLDDRHEGEARRAAEAALAEVRAANPDLDLADFEPGV